MAVLINLIVVIISQCICMLNYHVAQLKKPHCKTEIYTIFNCQSYPNKAGEKKNSVKWHLPWEDSCHLSRLHLIHRHTHTLKLGKVSASGPQSALSFYHC